MNWKDIQKKYPNAWDKLIDWANLTWAEWKESYLDSVSRQTIRWLYDFFDEQGIRCFIYYTENTGKWKPELRIKQSDTWKMKHIGIIKTENSRSEAEKQVFLKAFEILEEKLSSPETPVS